MNTETIIELIREKKDGVLNFKIRCNKHPELNNEVHWLRLEPEMRKIAHRVNNEYSEACFFTYED